MAMPPARSFFAHTPTVVPREKILLAGQKKSPSKLMLGDFYLFLNAPNRVAVRSTTVMFRTNVTAAEANIISEFTSTR